MQLNLRCTIFLISVITFFYSCTENRPSVLTQIESLQNAGEFTKAEALIAKYLENNPGIEKSMQQTLLFEDERGKRIIND